MHDNVPIALAVLAAVVGIARLGRNTAVGVIAFSWIGPRPRQLETWATYQFRWAVYSLDWLAQVAAVFAILLIASKYQPGISEHPLFMAFLFALSIGGGMALLAVIAFLVKAAKAKYIGPNPVWDITPVVEGIDV